MKKLKFQSPTGMRDILPGEQKYFRKIYNHCQDLAKFYKFGKIDTPIIEQTELFLKGIGLSTDIVQKEMYTFKARGGDSFSLRPEGTAPIARAYIERGMFNLPQPLKLWYFGPFFRAEKPQAGRYRQFWQFGFEVFGEKNPVVDAQIIQIFYNVLREIGIDNLIVEVNSIGDGQCRPYYKRLLVNYLKSREYSLCPDCKRRLKENPLRVLDCKEEKCQKIKAQAPQILDHLCQECHIHLKESLEFLDEIGLPYRLNPYLVRGLDYYTKTVFEIFTAIKEPILEEKSSKKEKKEKVLSLALAGGGRYDNLVKLLGGREVPAVGGAAGVERIIEAMRAANIKISEPSSPKIFLAQLGNLAKRKCLGLFEEFREAKIQVVETFGRDSLKAQLNRANRLDIRYVLILGQKEALEGTIIVRDMKTGRQDTIKIEKAVKEIKKRLKK